jgi:hypothetical protein
MIAIFDVIHHEATHSLSVPCLLARLIEPNRATAAAVAVYRTVLFALLATLPVFTRNIQPL